MTHLTADLVYWISEREAIRERRAAGMPPAWSADHIFQTVRFCNVHREDDTVTQWIRQNWNRAGDPAWKFVLGRMLNYVPTLESLKNFWSFEEFDGLADGLKTHRECGEKVFTSAYTISTCGKRMDKIDYVVSVVSKVMHPSYTSCQSAWEDLQETDGLGSFLAAQVVADMKNTHGHPLQQADDYMTFSAPGPGSLRGLSWFFHDQPDKVSAGAYHPLFKMCREHVDGVIPSWIRPIDNQDFQNCLCEFSKYMKLKRNPKAHVRNKVNYV
jgi:hypothetical protein